MNTRAQEYLDNLYIADSQKMIDFLQSRSKYRDIFDRDIFDRANIYNLNKDLHNLAWK